MTTRPPPVDTATDSSTATEAGIRAGLPAPGPAPIEERCPSCGTPLRDPYCAGCGERRPSDRRYSLRHFGGEVAESLTNADGTLWRTLKTLVSRPGELTAAYMRGQRVRYMKPLQLFVLVSVGYFVVTGITGTRAFDTPLSLHMRDPRIGYTAQRLVIKRVAERGTTLEAYATSFNRAATTQAKSLVIVMVPAFALLVGILEVRRRRFALQHLVFALHTYALLLIVNVAIDAGPLALVRLLSRVTGSSLDPYLLDQAMGVIIIGSMSAYLYLALRRAYGDGRLSAALKTLVLVLGIVVILVAYRYLLFFTTYWAT